MNLSEMRAEMRKYAAELAERKLGRKLTDSECGGLEAVNSLMMLEFICDEYAHESFSAEKVANSLGYWATQSISNINKQ
jgi:hypothetical protein